MRIMTMSRPLCLGQCNRCDRCNNNRHRHHQQQQQRRAALVVVGRLLLLCFFVNAMSGTASGVACEFYVGDYKTTTISTLSPSTSSLRHHHHSLHHSTSIDRNNEIIQDEIEEEMKKKKKKKNDDQSSEKEKASSGRRWGGGSSGLNKNQRQAAAILSPFNPLTPGGTIYLAFVFLIPLTVGKKLINGRMRDRGSTSAAAAQLERMVDSVRDEQETLYNEMGYVDGNLMVRTALKSLRNNVADKWWSLWSRRRLQRLLTIKTKNNKNKKNESQLLSDSSAGTTKKKTKKWNKFTS